MTQTKRIMQMEANTAVFVKLCKKKTERNKENVFLMLFEEKNRDLWASLLPH